MEIKMRINNNDFIEVDVSLESFKQLLDEKIFQIELQNQRIKDKANFLKKVYFLAIFSGFLLSILASTYLFIEILTKFK
tara:strand:- start:11 stop:247 length:237 start_codon:yes stop_codon:yes gene_type:complete